MATDVLILGAGLSGLVDAILLAETGRRVLVLEQHSIPGGYLQQFQRKRTVFDVGFHYMGSTEPGRPMRQFLEHLRVFERLELVPFPADAAIEVRRGAHAFAYPSTFARFLAKAEGNWPSERAGLARLAADVERLSGVTQWYGLRRGGDYGAEAETLVTPLSFARYAEELFDDPWLREVLAFQAFNLGLYAEEIPWTKHLLAFRSNFDTTCRIRGGGGALVAALVERGKELGVEYRFEEGVVRLEGDRHRVRAAHTVKGERIEAELFVAACHPKVVVRLLDEGALSPLFREHILSMKDSRGALQVFLRLSKPLESIRETCWIVRDDAEEARTPPISAVLVTYPMTSEHGERGGPRLEVMTYMDDSLFARWRDERVLRRGAEYEARKSELAERVLGILEPHIPELRARIEDVYTATPLSDQWYTKNEHGAVFGISHELAQQGRDRPQPRLRLENLFLTGHSIHMPGICGVFINAFSSCDRIRADGALFPAVATG